MIAAASPNFDQIASGRLAVTAPVGGPATAFSEILDLSAGLPDKLPSAVAANASSATLLPGAFGVAATPAMASITSVAGQSVAPFAAGVPAAAVPADNAATVAVPVGEGAWAPVASVSSALPSDPVPVTAQHDSGAASLIVRKPTEQMPSSQHDEAPSTDVAPHPDSSAASPPAPNSPAALDPAVIQPAPIAWRANVPVIEGGDTATGEPGEGKASAEPESAQGLLPLTVTRPTPDIMTMVHVSHAKAELYPLPQLPQRQSALEALSPASTAASVVGELASAAERPDLGSLPSASALSPLSAMPATLVSSLTDVPVPVLDTSVDDRWIAALAQDIAALQDEDGLLQFQLLPRNLGRIDVSVQNGRDGIAIQISAENGTAQSLLTAAQSRLLDDLRQNGVRIAGAEVGGEAGRQHHDRHDHDQHHRDQRWSFVETGNAPAAAPRGSAPRDAGRLA